ncbi:MAG TPA: hypothetical protein VF158_11520 [Longimicrobiales bacterium]
MQYVEKPASNNRFAVEAAMRISLSALSIVAVLAVAGCSDPTVPPIPETEQESQDSLPPKTSNITPDHRSHPGVFPNETRMHG